MGRGRGGGEAWTGADDTAAGAVSGAFNMFCEDARSAAPTRAGTGEGLRDVLGGDPGAKEGCEMDEIEGWTVRESVLESLIWI